MFSFIKSKPFFIHLGLITIVLVGIFLGVIKWLSIYTEHADFVQVPDFKGLELRNLENFSSDKNIHFEIIDSIYDPKEKAGIVLRQDPEALSKVKHNRTVYLYVTGLVPPAIEMPKLIDRSERQARLIISSYGLKLGKVITINADCNGCVVGQQIDGKDINEGDKVLKGSKINLVVGVKDNNYNALPNDTTKADDINFDEEE